MWTKGGKTHFGETTSEGIAKDSLPDFWEMDP